MPRGKDSGNGAKPSLPKPEQWPDVDREGPTGKRRQTRADEIRVSKRRAHNKEVIESLLNDFLNAEMVIFSSYQGLGAQDLNRIRHEVSEFGKWAVVRNSLAEIAARQAGLKNLHLTGDTALGFFKQDDIPAAAKVLSGLEKRHPQLILKGGIETVARGYITAEEIRALGSLVSREAVLSRLAGDMTALMASPILSIRASLARPVLDWRNVLDNER